MPSSRHAPLSLVETWLRVEMAPGMTLTDALASLNEVTGRRYTLSRLGEWRRGVLDVPRPARNYMARCAIGQILRDEGIDDMLITDEALDRIADRLS